DELDHHLSWFRQLIELQQDAHSPEEFLEFLKIDLYQDEIFVFTPRGDVKRLPKGATPIDFAFMVHTEVGQHCNGARVNGRIAPPTAEQLAQAAQKLGLGAAEQVETAIGRGDVQIGQVINALYPEIPPEEQQSPKPTAFGRVIERLRLGRGIKIHGVEGLMVR